MPEVEQPDAVEDLKESGPVPGEEQAEAEPQEKPEVKADADEQEESAEEPKPKRKGGWQRKIEKLEDEVELWRGEALKARDVSRPDPATSGPTKPVAPKLSEFKGTVEEFEAAQEKYAKDFAAYTEHQAEQKIQQQRIAQAQGNLLTQLKEMEDYDSIDEAAQEYYPSDLVPALAAECALLKNGAQVFRELMIDPDERDEALARIEVKDFAGVKAQISTLSRALRKTPKAADSEAAPKAPKPKPPNPVKKSAPTDTGLSDDLSVEEWVRRRNDQVKSRGGKIV